MNVLVGKFDGETVGLPETHEMTDCCECGCERLGFVKC